MSKWKQEQREQEMLNYTRVFWHESEKQNLIKRLLQKIYDLEDKVEILNKERETSNVDRL